MKRLFSIALQFMAAASFGGWNSAQASQCYLADCRVDKDGTIWCYNQETACPNAGGSGSVVGASGCIDCATCGATAVSVEDDTHSFACACQVCQVPSTCGTDCAVRRALPEPCESGYEEEAPVSGRIDDSASINFEDGQYGNHSAWYQLDRL
jgi:hypothetical protein